MATVTFDGASRFYAGTDRPAVDQLNLEVEDGEFLVLVGPSGCGKSTTLRMLAGLEGVDEGAIRIGEREVTDLPPKDRDIAMVFQNYALYPHMTVADNIGFHLKIKKVPKAERAERIMEAAKLLDLEPYLERKPAKLSGGQRQRVAMGRAIVRRPQVFCMDEPLSNLDAKLRVQTRTQIASLQRRLGVTTIYVTHDQIEAMTMGDRVAVMKTGVLQEVGDPQYLYDHPANIFVAGFIGSPPMNMAMGRIQRLGDGLTVRLGSTTLTLDPAVAAGRPALANYDGRDVAVGIRSEDMEDARLVKDAPPDTRLRAKVALVEALGSQIVVHFNMDAPKVRTEDTKLLDEDAHTEDVPAHDMGNRFVAAFAPRSRVRPNDDIEVVVDTERMHFFDPTTGVAIRG